MNTSRFFRTNDPQVSVVDGFVLPSTWWSRFYEYAWATQFVKEGETVLDAGCGIEHPFKFYLGKRCETWACDTDSEVTWVEIPVKCNLHLDVADITDLPYPGETFDSIFVISVLEHLAPVSRRDALVEFYSVLKPGGKLIMTLDYPTADPKDISVAAVKCGFSFAGDFDFTIPDDAISAGDLRCYRLVFVKGGE